MPHNTILLHCRSSASYITADIMLTTIATNSTVRNELNRRFYLKNISSINDKKDKKDTSSDTSNLNLWVLLDQTRDVISEARELEFGYWVNFNLKKLRAKARNLLRINYQPVFLP